MPEYKKLEELLANETYPHLYIHKFIGMNTQEFAAAVLQLELRFPKIKRTGERASTGAGQSYIAYTYEITVGTSAEIIELLKGTAQLPHLKIVL